MEIIEKTAEIPAQTEEKDSRETLARVTVFILLTGIPLFMTNKYFNITLSKFLFFAIVTAISFVLSFTLKPEDAVKIKNLSHRKMDIAVFGFLTVSFISAVFSKYPADAFFGSSGRCLGFCYVLLLAGLYWVLSRQYTIRKSEMIGYIAVFTVVMALAFMQFFGINVFGLYDNVTEQTIATYYSTIGNINVVSSYICLCVPFIMYAFCFATKLWKRCLLFLLCFSGFCFLVIVNSDSGYLGLFGAFCVVGIFLTKKPEGFYRILLLGSAFLFAVKLMYFITVICEGKTKELSPLAIMLGKSDVILVFAIISLVLSLVFAKVKIGKPFMSIIKVLLITVPVVLFLALTATVVYFTRFNTQAPLGELEGYLRFNDAWATGRGHIWRITMEAYSDMPFIKQLIGCGPDTLLPLLKENYDAEMLAMGAYTDNAHNEFMNYLVTYGAAGLVFYLSILVIALKNCLKKQKSSLIYGGLFAVIFSYALQSVVNISQPLTTPFYFVLMFISCCDYIKSGKNIKNSETQA